MDSGRVTVRNGTANACSALLPAFCAAICIFAAVRAILMATGAIENTTRASDSPESTGDLVFLGAALFALGGAYAWLAYRAIRRGVTLSTVGCTIRRAFRTRRLELRAIRRFAVETTTEEGETL